MKRPGRIGYGPRVTGTAVMRRTATEAKGAPAKAGALKIGIIGCAGRMGQMLVRAAAANDRCLVVGGSERSGATVVGKDVGLIAGIDPLGVTVGDDAAELFGTADAVLEFTNPTATVQHAEFAARRHKIHVIGTTGLEAPQIAALGRAAKQTAIVL